MVESVRRQLGPVAVICGVGGLAMSLAAVASVTFQSSVVGSTLPFVATAGSFFSPLLSVVFVVAGVSMVSLVLGIAALQSRQRTHSSEEALQEEISSYAHSDVSEEESPPHLEKVFWVASCAICLNDFVDESKQALVGKDDYYITLLDPDYSGDQQQNRIAATACGHMFCKPCIDQIDLDCPTCRLPKGEIRLIRSFPEVPGRSR